MHLDDVAQPDSTTFGRSVALKGDFAVVLTRSWTDGLYVLGGIYRGTAHGGTSIVYSDDYQEYRVGA